FKPGAHAEALRAKALRIQAQLAALYPSPPIPLSHGSAFQLLVAVMLSAQSTDVKVNTVTPQLFARGPDAAAMAQLQVDEIEGIIRVLGLAPTKAKNLLVEQHGGEVPASWEALEALPGVGHKTASVVMSQAFGFPAFPVDTHIHRLAQRWGLSSGKSVEQTEHDLKVLLPEATWRDAHLQIIYFGREHCPAQRHDPSACPVCSWAAPGAGSSSAALASGATGLGHAPSGPDGGEPEAKSKSKSPRGRASARQLEQLPVGSGGEAGASAGQLNGLRG
ncbi:Endonuclease III, partial [Tetrabaena socialis]